MSNELFPLHSNTYVARLLHYKSFNYFNEGTVFRCQYLTLTSNIGIQVKREEISVTSMRVNITYHTFTLILNQIGFAKKKINYKKN